MASVPPIEAPMAISISFSKRDDHLQLDGTAERSDVTEVAVWGAAIFNRALPAVSAEGRTMQSIVPSLSVRNVISELCSVNDEIMMTGKGSASALDGPDNPVHPFWHIDVKR